MPDEDQFHSLTTNSLLYDRDGVAGSPTLGIDRSELADRAAAWVPMVEQSSNNIANDRSCLERLTRSVRYRFVVPLKRSRHPPDYVARSVSAGLFWAMTPTIGIQMAMVLVHWIAVHKIERWEFNLIHAWAWTWVTNFATMIPVYYAFYFTGQLFLGNWNDLTGYYGFQSLWNESGSAIEHGGGGDGILQQAWYYVVGIVKNAWNFFIVVMRNWGLPMLVGCIPYAVVSAWLGYVWSMRIVVSHRRSVLDRRLHRHDRRMAAD